MSQVNVADQAVSFLLAVALGAAAGLFYCFFCALRKAGHNKKWETFFQDIFFWAVLAVSTFCFFLIRCRGEIRGFVYVGEGLGFLLFRLLLFPFVLKAFVFVFKIWEAICSPLARFFAFLGAAFGSCWGKICLWIEKSRKKIKKGRKKVLKAESEVLYNVQEIGA